MLSKLVWSFFINQRLNLGIIIEGRQSQESLKYPPFQFIVLTSISQGLSKSQLMGLVLAFSVYSQK